MCALVVRDLPIYIELFLKKWCFAQLIAKCNSFSSQCDQAVNFYCSEIMRHWFLLLICRQIISKIVGNTVFFRRPANSTRLDLVLRMRRSTSVDATMVNSTLKFHLVQKLFVYYKLLEPKMQKNRENKMLSEY